MKRFKLIKTIRKGIEGAILSGGAIEAGIQIVERSHDIDTKDIEHALAVLVAAGIGFFVKALKNWLKNRGK